VHILIIITIIIVVITPYTIVFGYMYILCILRLVFSTFLIKSACASESDSSVAIVGKTIPKKYK
jgi:hypothetical protein